MEKVRRDSHSSESSEELEYAAQFANRMPDEDDDEDSPTADNNEEFPSSGVPDNIREKEPVVFLIGWAGCTDTHLAKYSNMYAKCGLTTVAFKPQFRRYFITVDDMISLKKQAQKFLEISADLGLEEHPVFFHVFSNNGMAFYSELVELILFGNKYDHLKVCGAVLDSCPGRPHVSTLYRYSLISARMENLTTFQTLLRIACAFFFAVLSPLTRIIFGWRSLVSLANRARTEHWPLYYIYSDIDSLIPFKDVELSIRYRSQNGLPVGSHRFKDSVHVAHYVKYPDEYSEHCITFISNCLQN